MKHFTIWKTALTGLLLIGLLAGCSTPAGSGVSPSPEEETEPAETTQVLEENGGTGAVEQLTQEELAEWTDCLRSGYGNLFSAPFGTFDEIDLSLVLHDGAGEGVTRDFTEEDRAALASIGVDLDEALGNQLGVKLTGAEINARLEELYGFTLTDEELQERIVEQSKYNGWGEWFYAPSNGRYYHFSNGTTNIIVNCVFGLRRADGSLTLICRSLYGGNVYQVELQPAETGYRFIMLVQLTEKDLYEGEGLTKAELNEVARWLNQPGNCELFWSGFSVAEEADISALFYDGAGIGTTDQLSEKEAAALETLGLGLELDTVKVPAAEALLLLQDKLCLYWDREQLRERLADSGWCYLEEYDAFYHAHGDTMMVTIACEEGVRWDNGMLVVRCHLGEVDDTAYTVMLYPTETGYQIYSIEQD